VTVAYRQYTRRQKDPAVRERMAALAEHEQVVASMSLPKIVGLFAGGIAGVLVGAELLIHGAVGVASTFGLSPEVIGLTVVAIGTSVPEIVTCVASALKKQSQIGVGNIIGADILNICWVAGASALANPLTAEINVIWFMFPVALVLVGAMVILLRMGYNLTRWNGAALLALYAGYMALLLLGVGR
jgi:cation:H+ antiporter